MSKRPRIQMLKPRVAALKVSNTGGGLGRLSSPSRAVYQSRRWRERVRPAKLLADPLCQRCKYIELSTAATDVDHWTRIGEGGDPWDASNLVSLCSECHDEKTKLERAGLPLFAIAPSASPASPVVA